MNVSELTAYLLFHFSPLLSYIFVIHIIYIYHYMPTLFACYRSDISAHNAWDQRRRRRWVDEHLLGIHGISVSYIYQSYYIPFLQFYFHGVAEGIHTSYPVAIVMLQSSIQVAEAIPVIRSLSSQVAVVNSVDGCVCVCACTHV